MDDRQIVDTYRGLWEIEETFRIAKGELEARPIFVSREDHIEAHFLICFISLIIVRLLQKLTGNMFSAGKISEALNRISCSNIQENLFLFDYRTDVTDKLSEATGVDFTKKHLRLKDIKTFLGNTKI